MNRSRLRLLGHLSSSLAVASSPTLVNMLVNNRTIPRAQRLGTRTMRRFLRRNPNLHFEFECLALPLTDGFRSSPAAKSIFSPRSPRRLRSPRWRPIALEFHRSLGMYLQRPRTRAVLKLRILRATLTRKSRIYPKHAGREHRRGLRRVVCYSLFVKAWFASSLVDRRIFYTLHCCMTLRIAHAVSKSRSNS